MEAAIAGDTQTMRCVAADNPGLLDGRTTAGNTWLHISSIHGHEHFCTEVLDRYLSKSLPLLSAGNSEGETPLVTAVINGHASLASQLLKYYRNHGSGTALLQQDTRRCNVLHHAISNGYTSLALELIAAAPALSHARNRFDESPMFLAVLRDNTHVLDELLKIQDSEHSGTCGYNALHAAVKYDNAGES